MRVTAGVYRLVAEIRGSSPGPGMRLLVVKIIFILLRTTGHIPVVWARLVAYTKLQHPHEEDTTRLLATN